MLQNVYLRIFNNQTLDVYGCSINQVQNEVGTFDVDIRYADLSITPVELFLQPVVLFGNGEVIVSGIVDSYDLKRSDTEGTFITLRCLDELGRLATVRAKSDGHYQNQTIIFIITDLLNETSDWELGDTSTLTDLALATTVDLRDKEFLWAQLVAAVDTCPNTFIRYGGISNINGKFQIDIGMFDEKGAISFIQDHNLIDLQYKQSFHRPFYEIEAYGGKSGPERITLQDALNYDPSLSTDPDYPIVTSGGKLVVRNESVFGVGLTAVKQYSQNKTKNDTVPDDTAKEEAGYALWQSVVADMQKGDTSGEYTVTIISDDVLDMLSKRILVRGVVKEQGYNISSGLPELIETFAVQDFLRVVKFKLDFGMNAFAYTIEMREGNYITDPDSSAQMYKTLSKTDDADSGSGVLPVNIVTDSVSHGTGVASDQTHDGFNWKRFSFAFPSGPSSNTVNYTPSISPTSYTYMVMTPAPAPPATPLLIDVRPIGGSWTNADQATVSVVWITS